MRRLAPWAALLLLTSCALDRSGLVAFEEDARSADAGSADAPAPVDAPAADAPTPDAPTLDVGGPDTGSSDAGRDGGPMGVDAGRDAGPPDTGPPDTGPPDTGSPDTCIATPETCDGMDEDCDGRIDEGAGVCPCSRVLRAGRPYLLCGDANWSQARSGCAGLGYQLIVIDDVAEDSFAWTTLQADRPGAELWIGLHDMGTANHYRWVDGRTARVGDVDMTYTNWRGGRPEDDASQECIQLDSGSAGQWADHPCNDRLPYMCELR